MRSGLRSRFLALALLGALGVLGLAAPRYARAQQASAEEPRKPLTLALEIDEGAALDGEGVRAQLERELGVVVVRAEVPAEVTADSLRIQAPSLANVRVAFGDSERTVDLSSTGPHAVETLALVAANLMRDEASDLLATLRATETEPSPIAPAPTPQPTALPPAKPERRGCDPTRAKRVPLGVNLLPYVGTSSSYGVDVTQPFALNLIGGSAASLDGFELAGVFNHESYSVCGVQLSGGANLVSGPMEGFQLAALNMVDGRVDGGQLALINTSSGTMRGFQAAFLNLALRGGGGAVQVGFANIVTGHLVGTQLGFGNVATGSLDGGQVGFGNVSLGDVSGAQGGFANVARRSLSGAQAGFVNVAAGESTGLQLGFVNVTGKRSRGLMFGFINVAGEADAAIGVVNIYTRGRIHLDAWVTDAGVVMTGVEHGGKVFHNILGVGSTVREGREVFTFAYGFGLRAFQQTGWYVDVDALAYGMVSGGESSTDNPDFGAITQLRVPLVLRMSKWLALFAAPSLSLSVARNHENNSLREPGFYGARVTNTSSDVASYIWPGATLGVRFF